MLSKGLSELGLICSNSGCFALTVIDAFDLASIQEYSLHFAARLDNVLAQKVGPISKKAIDTVSEDLTKEGETITNLSSYSVSSFGHSDTGNIASNGETDLEEVPPLSDVEITNSKSQTYDMDTTISSDLPQPVEEPNIVGSSVTIVSPIGQCDTYFLTIKMSTLTSANYRLMTMGHLMSSWLTKPKVLS